MTYTAAEPVWIGYTIPANGPDIINDFKDHVSSGGGWLAERAAEDYHDHGDGWEASWPIVFRIIEADGTLIGTYSVDRDFSPVFSAYKVKE